LRAAVPSRGEAPGAGSGKGSDTLDAMDQRLAFVSSSDLTVVGGVLANLSLECVSYHCWMRGSGELAGLCAAVGLSANARTLSFGRLADMLA